MLRIRESAFEHGITKDQIAEVLANQWSMTKWFQIHDDAYGNSQDMAVGFDAEGTLVELGISYVDEDDIVFHADTATTAWRNKYNEV